MFTLDPGRSQVTMYVHLVADIGSITMRLLIPRLVKNAAMVATVYVIVLLYVHKSKLSIINLCSNSLQNQVDMCQLCPHWWHRWLSLRQPLGRQSWHYGDSWFSMNLIALFV